jgi:hypothetical protein
VLELYIEGTAWQWKIERNISWSETGLPGISIEHVQHHRADAPVADQFLPAQIQIDGGVIGNLGASVARLPLAVDYAIDGAAKLP